MNGNESMKEYPEKLASGFYRVRLGEEKLGQFRILSKAKSLCDENTGSQVYAPNGAVVYLSVETEDASVENAPVENAAESVDVEETTEAEKITEAAGPTEEQNEPIA